MAITTGQSDHQTDKHAATSAYKKLIDRLEERMHSRSRHKARAGNRTAYA